MFPKLSVLVYLTLMLTLTFSEDDLDTPLDTDECPCGRPAVPDITGWVTGGDTVNDVRKYPWIVSIHVEGEEDSSGGRLRGFCGGALITLEYVLTAAHCLINKSAISDCNGEECWKAIKRGLYVRLVSNPDGDALGDKFEVEEVVVHPGFRPEHIDNDIGLMKLRNPAPCSEFSIPVCISKQDVAEVGSALTIAGYGMTKSYDTDSYPDDLRAGVTEVVKEELCNVYDPEYDNQILCTLSDYQEVCHADSGTAGIQKHNERFFAVSITNGGIKFCPLNRPAYHAKVSHFYPFIVETVRGSLEGEGGDGNDEEFPFEIRKSRIPVPKYARRQNFTK